MRRLILSIAFSLLTAVACLAQARTRFVFTAGSSDLTPATTLPEKQVMVSIGGHQVPVRSVMRIQDTPIQVVIMLDTSASMREGGKWDMSQAIVVELLRDLPKGSTAGLMSFSDNEVEIITSPASILNSLQRMASKQDKPHGQTRLWDSILVAASSFHHRPGDAIVVVTDGGDTGSRKEPADVQKVLFDNGVRLNAITLREYQPQRELRFPQTDWDLYVEQDLLELARSTGGMSLTEYGNVRNKPYLESLQQEIRKFVVQLTDFNLCDVDFAPQNDSRPKLRVQVVDEKGKPYKELIVRAPERLGKALPSGQATAAHP